MDSDNKTREACEDNEAKKLSAQKLKGNEQEM